MFAMQFTSSIEVVHLCSSLILDIRTIVHIYLVQYVSIFVFVYWKYNCNFKTFQKITIIRNIIYKVEDCRSTFLNHTL